MELANRVALVTGASRGIGREIALGYATAGAHVVATARDTEQLEQLAGNIRADGGSCSVYRMDVTDAAAIAEVVHRVVDRLGRIDVLCNNAGVNSAVGRVADVPTAPFAQVFAVNVLGLYACCHAVMPHMVERRYGRIVNVSSGAALICGATGGAYASSKAAVNALTAVIAKEGREHNVLANAMSPGSVRTAMNPTADTPASASVPTALWLASLDDDGPTGRCYRFLTEIPMIAQQDIDWGSAQSGR